MTNAGHAPAYLGTKKRAVLFLRWVVIIVTSYLLLFGSAPDIPPWGAPLFVAIFLASNLAAGAAPEELFDRPAFQGALVAVVTILVSVGMLLASDPGGELFLLYFSVLFLAALGESLSMIIAGCLLIAAVYLGVLLQTNDAAHLLTPAVLLRFPFLFAIATFYGYLVEVAKGERRRAEVAVAQERFRTDFLATLTHDLQSPLSAITGFTGLLQEAPGDAPVSQYRRVFAAVRRGAEECNELLASFLALLRGQTRPGSLRRQVFDLNEVAREIQELHENAARTKGARLQVVLADDLPPISGDRLQIRRAIGNLVGNAVKFVGDGGRIEVTTRRDGAAAVLTVHDDGPGIPEALQPQIFEQYVRGEARGSGTGLGLFVVRLVAEAHGGSVTLESRPGGGSTRFQLRIPLPGDVPVRVPQPVAPRRVPSIAPELATGEDGVR